VRTHQEVARYVGEDLAYVVLRETIRFKNPADGRAVVQELRVTQIFRREEGRWRIVHRHADSQVVSDPAGRARGSILRERIASQPRNRKRVPPGVSSAGSFVSAVLALPAGAFSDTFAGSRFQEAVQ
jgi:hypothetical protein